MFERLISFAKGMIRKMLNVRTDTRISGGVPIAVSSDMAAAIQRWCDEYVGKAYWLNENRQSLNLPATIASEMATLVTLEAQINITGSERAEWLMKQIRPVVSNLHTKVEYACAMGGIVMKPYPDNGRIAIDYIHADDFYPVSFNSRGEITSAIFIERKTVGQTVFSRVEHHTINGDRYTILNRCFRGFSKDDLGQEVPLNSVDEWQDIEPEVSIENIDFPLFAYFKIPLGNTVDPKSPLGVSVYAKAEENIREADLQYQRLLWEYKGGEMAIDASEDAFDIDPKTRTPIIPVGKERLWRVNKLDSSSAGGHGLFDVFAPELRDASYKAGLNTILQKIEHESGLSYGTISDPTVEVKTATEIKISRQRTYATVTAIQTSLGDAIEGLVRAMDTMATLYGLFPSGAYEVSCKWDDSVITDADTERMRDLQETRDGIMQKWEYRVKWYGEDESTAKAMTQSGVSDDEIMGFVSAPATPKPLDQQ